jgi:hypothetical protein
MGGLSGPLPSLVVWLLLIVFLVWVGVKTLNWLDKRDR